MLSGQTAALYRLGTLKGLSWQSPEDIHPFHNPMPYNQVGKCVPNPRLLGTVKIPLLFFPSTPTPRALLGHLLCLAQDSHPTVPRSQRGPFLAPAASRPCPLVMFLALYSAPL